MRARLCGFVMHWSFGLGASGCVCVSACVRRRLYMCCAYRTLYPYPDASPPSLCRDLPPPLAHRYATTHPHLLRCPLELEPERNCVKPTDVGSRGPHLCSHCPHAPLNAPPPALPPCCPPPDAGAGGGQGPCGHTHRAARQLPPGGEGGGRARGGMKGDCTYQPKLNQTKLGRAEYRQRC